jgi:hypothetical protein
MFCSFSIGGSPHFANVAESTWGFDQSRNFSDWQSHLKVHHFAQILAVVAERFRLSGYDTRGPRHSKRG